MCCAAPEVLISNGSYDGQKADVWSCGVMLYVMLFCKYPFGPYNGEVGIHGFRKVHQRILRVEYEIPTECQVRGSPSTVKHRCIVPLPDSPHLIAGSDKLIITIILT